MIIYVYTLTCYPSLIKIGQTKRDVEKRVKEQVGILPIVNGIKPYTILYQIDDKDLNVNISDKEIHKALKKYHVSGEWFNCTIKQLDNTIKRIAKKKIQQGHVYLNENELRASKGYKPKKKYKTSTLTYNNETLPISEWSKITGLSISLIHNRLSRGWSIKEILTKPNDHKRRVGYRG